MKYIFIRSQLIFVSVILFLTLGMMMAIVMRYNSRWDFTKEKIYSLSDPTKKLLDKLRGDTIQAFVFYPQDDPARGNFEVFLKEVQLHHPSFSYYFYDPDRVP
ncbi:MAG: GldG family protein, partial [candidate division Zixibacteria bacterium]|nr:GldG family protein [candidate division Zixibacteria bacterium]